MRLRLREFRVAGHRVVQPWKPLRHTALSDPEQYGIVIGDQDGLHTLAGLFAFASCSRRTIVHVPLRDGPPLDGEEEFVRVCGGRLDLVLAHHSLGFRITRWPDLRGRLRHGRPLTVATDEARTERHAATWLAHASHTGARDWLRPRTHANTLFLTGSRPAFASASTELTQAALEGPGLRRVHKGHAQLVTSLTGELEPDHTRRSPELDILFKPYPPLTHFRRNPTPR